MPSSKGNWNTSIFCSRTFTNSDLRTETTKNKIKNKIKLETNFVVSSLFSL